MECLGCGTSSEILNPWLCSECVEELLREAKVAEFPNEETLCLYALKNVTRKLIHGLKYQSLSGVASYLVHLSFTKGNGESAFFFQNFAKPFYFAPIPLHPMRYRERGYNQAEKIAAAFSREVGGQLVRWFKRKKFLVSQTKLSKEERARNVAGAFEVKLPEHLPNRGTLFIVDDVFTTGATTAACQMTLPKDFPLNVKICTLLYDKPTTATMDFAADKQSFWEV